MWLWDSCACPASDRILRRREAPGRRPRLPPGITPGRDRRRSLAWCLHPWLPQDPRPDPECRAPPKRRPAESLPVPARRLIPLNNLMKLNPFLVVGGLTFAVTHSLLYAQSEGGNSGPSSGGSSANSGTAGSGADFGPDHGTGGKNTSGGSSSVSATTNAPSDSEFHPPATSASR